MTGSSCAAPFQGAMIIKRLCGLSCSILHPLREDCIPLPPVLSPSKAVLNMLVLCYPLTHGEKSIL